MNYREYYSFLGFLWDLLWHTNFKGQKTDSCFMQMGETTQRTSLGIDICGIFCSIQMLYLGSWGSFSLVCTSPNHTLLFPIGNVSDYLDFYGRLLFSKLCITTVTVNFWSVGKQIMSSLLLPTFNWHFIHIVYLNCSTRIPFKWQLFSQYSMLPTM